MTVEEAEYIFQLYLLLVMLLAFVGGLCAGKW